MSSNFSPNPRMLEPRLAPRFHELLAKYPPSKEEPRTQERAEALMADAVQWKASDLHIEPGRLETRIRLRVDGVLHDAASVYNFSGHRLVAYFKTLSGIDATALAKPEHGHGRAEVADTVLELRTTVAPTPDGEMVGIRLLDTRRPMLRLHDLGMAETDQKQLRAWLEGMQGMILVCGPVGAGKTSTLYALLHELQTLPRSIITVEDPVEGNLDGITQIEVNPRRGLHFPDAIRAMLRLDPDFLLVGEIRDAESAHVAITAAGTGHALLSTIHARDTAGAVTALRNNGVKDCEIANALQVCVSQRLVRRLCPHCRVTAPPTAEEKAWLADKCDTLPDSLWKPDGCNACAGTGFDGRVGLFEIWCVSPEARLSILQGGDEFSFSRQAAGQGSKSLLQDAIGKMLEGRTSLSEIRHLSGRGSHLPSACA